MNRAFLGGLLVVSIACVTACGDDNDAINGGGGEGGGREPTSTSTTGNTTASASTSSAGSTSATTSNTTSGTTSATTAATTVSTTSGMGVCGNDALEPGEECDDGNTFPWDGCSDACEINFLNVAIETSGSCLNENQASLVVIQDILETRGHTATIVDGSALDTPAEIGAYDVIYLGGWTSNCQQGVHDLGLFDGQVNAYLAGGGGISTGAWTIWLAYLAGAPNIEAALPQAVGEGYADGPITVVPVGAHPIVSGITSFDAIDYVATGDGAKAGADVLLTSGGLPVGTAWTVQTNGRVSWLGPLFNESYTDYENENLTDGSQPQAIELVARSIEWAGGWY